MKWWNSQQAQSTLEVALVFAIIVAALTCMFKFVQRAVQGKFKAGADSISQRQYEVGKTVITGR